jgi:hypothetical protein
MRELDKSEIEMLWALYNVEGRTRSQFVTLADQKLGDVPMAALGAIWDAFDSACDLMQ